MFDNLRSMIREEVNTALDQRTKPSSPIPSSSRSFRRPVVISSDSELEEGELTSVSDPDSSDEKSGRALCLPEETDYLLKAVRATMGIEDPKEPLSLQDQMFQGLDSRDESSPFTPVSRRL